MIANCKCGYSWNTSSQYPRCTRCRKVIARLGGKRASVSLPLHSPSSSKKAASLTDFHLWLKENKFLPNIFGKKGLLVQYYRNYLDFKGLGHTHYPK